MGFLTIFKKKENDQEDLYKTLVIKRILDDIDKLNSKVEAISYRLEKLEKVNIKQDTKNKTLTKQEKRIVETQNKFKCKNVKELAAKTNIKPQSLRVYISKIRAKEHALEFE